MAKNIYKLIFDLRLTVGYLGEKDQHAWWGSSFLAPASRSFLAPVFVKTTLLAQYNGVCLAAARVHDEHIGLGLHYHLYRLPDQIECLAVNSVGNEPKDGRPSANFASAQAALSYLEQFGGECVAKSEGPLVVGDFSERQLESLLRQSASHYFQAFTQAYRCYPYMRHAG